MMRAGRIARRLLVLGGIAVVAVPWVFAVRELTKSGVVKSTTTVTPPHAITWGGRVFSTPAALDAWLRSRGGSYGVWAAHHPNESAILERRAPPPSTSTVQATGTGSSSQASPPSTTGQSAAPQASPAATATASTGRSLSWLRIALLVVATIAMLAALVPSPVLGPGGAPWFSATQRAYLFAAGFSVGVGVLVAGALA